MTSVDYPGPENEGSKGDMKFHVCLFEPVGEDTSRSHVVVVLSIDVGGLMPTAIANQVMKTRVGAWEKIKEILDGKLYKD